MRKVRDKGVWEVRKVEGRCGGRLLWRGDGSNQLDTKNLRTPCLCGFFSRLCAEEDAQRTGNEILNSNHLGATWGRQFDVQHLRKLKVGGNGVAAHSVIYGQDGHVESTPIDVEFVNVACKQGCMKVDKGGAEIFVEENVDKVGGRETCHGKLNALLGQIAPDLSEVGVAVFI